MGGTPPGTAPSDAKNNMEDAPITTMGRPAIVTTYPLMLSASLGGQNRLACSEALDIHSEWLIAVRHSRPIFSYARQHSTRLTYATKQDAKPNDPTDASCTTIMPTYRPFTAS